MFVGRQNELETLARLWRKDSASLVVCSGRRRIGKSTLIEEFAARSKCRFVETLVREKIARLALPREISVRKALVYEGELNPQNRENGYFDFLISADRLLGREL